MSATEPESTSDPAGFKTAAASLTPASFETALRHLGAADPDLAGILRDHGPPPIWRLKPGYTTLVRIILEQQVSLASARRVFERLLEAVAPFGPEALLQAGDDVLGRAGLTRQKMSYCRHLAEAVVSGALPLDRLPELDDAEARERLTAVKGIGRWTADVYLLRALLRPDVWPPGDIGLIVAAKEIKGLEERPDPARLEALAEPWRPWRAVAARLLWHYYLATRG